MKKASMVGAIVAGCLFLFMMGAYANENHLSAKDTIRAVTSLGAKRRDTEQDRFTALCESWDLSRDTIVELLEPYNGKLFADLEVDGYHSNDQYEWAFFTGKYVDAAVQMRASGYDVDEAMCEIVHANIPIKFTEFDGRVHVDNYEVLILYYSQYPRDSDYEGPVEGPMYSVYATPDDLFF